MARMRFTISMVVFFGALVFGAIGLTASPASAQEAAKTPNATDDDGETSANAGTEAVAGNADDAAIDDGTQATAGETTGDASASGEAETNATEPAAPGPSESLVEGESTAAGAGNAEEGGPGTGENADTSEAGTTGTTGTEEELPPLIGDDGELDNDDDFLDLDVTQSDEPTVLERQIVGIVASAVTVAALAAGVVFGGLAYLQFQCASDVLACNQSLAEPIIGDQLFEARANVENLALLADMFYLFAAASALVAVTGFVRGFIFTGEDDNGETDNDETNNDENKAGETNSSAGSETGESPATEDGVAPADQAPNKEAPRETGVDDGSPPPLTPEVVPPSDGAATSEPAAAPPTSTRLQARSSSLFFEVE